MHHIFILPFQVVYNTLEHAQTQVCTDVQTNRHTHTFSHAQAYNTVAMKTSLYNLGKLVMRMQLKDLRENRFLPKFNDPLDNELILLK